MKSHAILRTNVGLTTNAKIMVTGSYSLYIDSITSNSELSSTKYKKKEFNKSNYWDEIVPYFFKGTPPEIAFFIKDDGDSNNMSKEFSKQYDDTYQYGARNIIENKDYTEEYEYFAPLHISKTGIPKKFVIFRIDGTGLSNSNKDNFKTEILNKLKCVKIFDLTRNSPLGEWIETNVTKNKNFPQTGLYIDFRNLEFSSWFGIDYEDGGYSEKSLLLDNTFSQEQTYQDFEKFILNGYKNNKIVYPHIFNFSFLFDDTPATPSSIRTWSLNRYLGFYLDELEFVKYVSPYNLPKIKSDVIIDSNNLIYSLTDTNPFEQTFKREENPYIEIEGQFYKIEKFLEQQPSVLTRVEVARNTFVEQPNQSYLTKYKIISNINLQGKESMINKNLILVDSSTGRNKITGIGGGVFEIENFEDADVWLIEIDNLYHNIIKDEIGEYYINTDYAFNQSLEKFEYYINDPNPLYRKTVKLVVDSENAPKQFAIYKCKFTDIKDFDLDIVDTEYSKFEYSFVDKLTISDETKMYGINQNSKTYPKDLDDFRINGEVVNIPSSSEYVANSELFRLLDKNLNDLWKKNPKRVKWGFQNSISSNDYPYLLNNSFSSEDYNRTVNPYNPLPNREDRNLDYFLTINPDSDTYLHHSLHVIEQPEITFSQILPYSTTYVGLSNISDISTLNVFDLIQINCSNPLYDAKKARINSLIYSNLTGWLAGLDLNYIPILGTVSGTITNLTRTNFSLDKYLNYGYLGDYFSYFFGKKTEFDSGKIIKNTQKWSYFNSGDNSFPNITVFRGLKFKVWDVAGVKIKDDNVDSINIKSNNNYEDFKFAILLSKNNFNVSSNFDNNNGATVSFFDNNMKWQIIDDWKHDKIYYKNDLVKYNDSIYVAVTQSQITNPTIFPFSSLDWTIYSAKNIFWNTTYDGSGITASKNNVYELGQKVFSNTNVIIPPLVLNGDEYYYSSGGVGSTFWKPGTTYNQNQRVLHKNSVWVSNTNNNLQEPNVNSYFLSNGEYRQSWIQSTTQSTIWREVEIWDEKKEYKPSNSLWAAPFSRGHYVIFEEVVYATLTETIKGTSPKIDVNWKRLYSIAQDTNFKYGVDFNNNYNPIVKMNNRYYLCRENGFPTTSTSPQSSKGKSTNLRNLSTLENGINIYINKKWKNILINIYINDNTYSTIEDLGFGTIVYKKDNLSNTKRDDLYSDIYTKLSAYNFMNAINDLSNSYDFSDKIRYVIINEDGSLQLYDFNDLNTVENLPTLLTCEGPDEFLVKIGSLSVKPINLSSSQIKPRKQLLNGEVSSLSEINYYAESNLATEINQSANSQLKVSNYSSLKNKLYNNLFRHSGYYSPIFHTVELFKSASLTQSGGNYKFDTTLTNFGRIKERIVTKVNKEKNILKLKNNPELLSVYPMLDEFGYHTISFYIFKSTWDIEYHVECQESKQSLSTIGNQSLQFTQPSNNTNNINLNLL